MTQFYSSIAPHYDAIFPYQPVQKDFVLSYNPGGRGSSLLDVGCGTGSLVMALADHFDEVVGIDPDEEMLHIARQKAEGRGQKEGQNAEGRGQKAEGENIGEERDEIVGGRTGEPDLVTGHPSPVTRHASRVTLFPLGMLDLEDRFAEGRFDVVLCLGNTLVHLASDDEVMEFLRQVHGVLKPGGSLIIQIINYERVIDKKLGGLPTIENEQIRFERIYQYPEKPIHITFITRLTMKESGEVIENRVPLLALRPGRLKELLAETGFGGLEAYGSFSREGFGEGAQAVIVKTKKEE